MEQKEDKERHNLPEEEEEDSVLDEWPIWMVDSGKREKERGIKEKFSKEELKQFA